MTIEFGSFSFDETVLFRQFRNDLKDDWFPDPFNFKDMIEGQLVSEAITRNFELHHGQYQPTPGQIYNIPKPNYTLRYGIEFGIADRVFYHGTTSFLVPYFDPLIPWFVFSHRGAREQKDRYLFRRGIPAWRDFIGSVRSTLKDSAFLLSTDLTNYFENINMQKLRDTFLDLLPRVDAPASVKGVIRVHVETLFRCLQSWTSEGTIGLPQNRDASSFLANIYMSPVDRQMQEKGYAYFRYMDDIKIVCSDEFETRRALKDLILALRDRGLAVNSKKTILCAATETEKVSECLDVGVPEVEQLDALWSTRSQKVIRRTFPQLQALTRSLLGSNKVDSREFRYCITRLALLGACDEFAVPEEYFAPITELVISKIPHFPAATDQFVKYLLAVPLPIESATRIVEFLADTRKSFYTWQNFRLWSLLTQKNFRDPAALKHAAQMVELQDDNATRAGATFYAGALGGVPERELIGHRFPSLASFLGQRTAIIATHELPFRPVVEQYVKPHIRDDLQNVYRHMRPIKGTYFSPLERVSITKIIDSERDYD